MPSKLEADFLLQLITIGHTPVTEHKFHPVRKWRLDFAYPDRMIAVEIEGGTWTGGRHVRGAGYSSNCEKYNEAMLLGWSIFRFTTDQIRNGNAIKFMGALLNDKTIHT